MPKKLAYLSIQEFILFCFDNRSAFSQKTILKPRKTFFVSLNIATTSFWVRKTKPNHLKNFESSGIRFPFLGSSELLNLIQI